MSAFDVLFPAGMIVAPALFLGLWCHWTGARGMRRTLVATLAVLLGFGASGLVFGVSDHAHRMIWGLGGLWLVLFGFAVPEMRRHVRGLPEVPARGASLAPRRLDLFRGAFVWPYVAWAGLAAAALLRGEPLWRILAGPGAGLLSLLVVQLVLPRTLFEPEPLGGADPDGLARRYEEFRRRRVRSMYGLFVALALVLAAGPLVAERDGWLGGLAGAAVGLWGALLGTWADAQRYLLRRQLSGAEPPGRIPA